MGVKLVLESDSAVQGFLLAVVFGTANACGALLEQECHLISQLRR